MKLKYSYIVLFAFSMVFIQCKKKKHETPAPPVSTAYTDVCTPKSGSTQYIPLAIGNTWTYAGALLPLTSTITKDTVAFGNTYYVATFSPSGILPNSYQRYNTAGALVGLDSLAQGKSTEAILIPAIPSVGTFSNNSQATSSVLNINQSLTTTACSYTGLLQIQVVTSLSTTTYYYKKGIGLVSIACSSSSSSCAFSSVYLQSMKLY